MRQQFSAITDSNMNIGAFLALSSDREGGHKERALKRQSGVALNDDYSIAHSASDHEQ